MRKARAFQCGINCNPVIFDLSEQFLPVVLLSQGSCRIRCTQHTPQIPQIVSDDMVFAVPETLTVSRSAGQHSDEGRVVHSPPTGLHGPSHGTQHAGVGPLQELPVAGDSGVLPQGPGNLPVGVELLDLVAAADFSNYATAFGSLMRTLFADWHLRLVDPQALRPLTAPALAALVERWPEVEERLRRGGEMLIQEGREPPLRTARGREWS